MVGTAILSIALTIWGHARHYEWPLLITIALVSFAAILVIWRALSLRPIPEQPPGEHRNRAIGETESADPNAPQITMGWDSPEQPWQRDTIRLKNIGKSTALNIRVGNFSWEDLSWHRQIEIQSIDPDMEIAQEAQFTRLIIPGSSHIGRMRRILECGRQSPPLSIDVSFLDVNRTTFTRTFFLRFGGGIIHSVMVDLGPLSVKREHGPVPLSVDVPPALLIDYVYRNHREYLEFSVGGNAAAANLRFERLPDPWRLQAQLPSSVCCGQPKRADVTLWRDDGISESRSKELSDYVHWRRIMKDLELGPHLAVTYWDSGAKTEFKREFVLDIGEPDFPNISNHWPVKFIPGPIQVKAKEQPATQI